jgi:hypothetical protein
VDVFETKHKGNESDWEHRRETENNKNPIDVVSAIGIVE